MTADLYCTRADVNRRLPIGSVVSAGGIGATADATTNVFEYDGHGLETDDSVILRVVEGGTLPAPLVAETTYYAIRLSNSTFKLAATAAGVAIDITTSSTDVVISREPSFDEHIEFYSRWADTFLPAHLVPLTGTIPAIVKGIVADLAAKRILNIAGQDSAVINSAELASKAMLERFSKGLPTRDVNVSTSANKAITSSLGTTADPRGWAPSGSGTLP